MNVQLPLFKIKYCLFVFFVFLQLDIMHGSISKGNGQDCLSLECFFVFFQCLLNVVNIAVVYLVVYIAKYISLIPKNKCMFFPFSLPHFNEKC